MKKENASDARRELLSSSHLFRLLAPTERVGLSFSRSMDSAKLSKKPAQLPGRYAIFDQFPLYLRQGQWSIVAKVYISVIMIALVCAPIFLFEPEELPSGSDTPFHSLPTIFSESPRMVSALLAFYMAGVLGLMFRYVGPWPFTTFTMLSWTLTCSRHAGRALGISLELLRFPALVAATITFFVWWLLLVPAIYFLGCKTQEQKRGFVAFNCAPFLVNIHIINFPLMIVDQMLSPRAFVATDLWLGVVYGMCYLLFYLNVLDPKGLHFYIIFSPRTRLCFIPYSMMLLLIYAVYSQLSAPTSTR